MKYRVVSFLLIVSSLFCYGESFSDYHKLPLKSKNIEWRLAENNNDSVWKTIPMQKDGLGYVSADGRVSVSIRPDGENTLSYHIQIIEGLPTRYGLFLSTNDKSVEENVYHVIPGLVYGDNNYENMLMKEKVPHLTNVDRLNDNCSSMWEYRSDRSATPISAMCLSDKVIGISTFPYFKGILDSGKGDDNIPSGVIAILGDGTNRSECGISLGYANYPFTYIHQGDRSPYTCQKIFSGSDTGYIYVSESNDRREVNKFIRNFYPYLHAKHVVTSDVQDIVEACATAMRDAIWSSEDKSYCNLYYDTSSRPYQLHHKRALQEVGWCGGPVLAYPAMKASFVLKDTALYNQAFYTCNKISSMYNPKSGMIYDYGMKGEKNVNGWWTKAEKNRHWAYTNGTCISYLLQSARLMEKNGIVVPKSWYKVSRNVLNTIVKNQLADGNLGYSYHMDRKGILDSDGFAGSYFIPGLVLASEHFKDIKYLHCAEKALKFYHQYVKNLNSWGAPMDTKKADNEEGILGFIRAARLLHEYTGNSYYLEALKDGIDFECTWRYSYKSNPLFPPLSGGWNSCGGSLTSTANPHIHPMGIQVMGDFLYYAQKTGDKYVQSRCVDGVRWAMHSIEFFHKHTGIEPKGIISERFCPSDGLVIEKYPYGGKASIWYSCHAFGVASILEGLLDVLPNKDLFEN